MKNIRAGSLEMAILLAVKEFDKQGYGVNIQEKASDLMEKKVSFGSMYTTLHRLEEVGFLKSDFGNPTPERGGRAKKFYEITGTGLKALHDAMSRMRSMLPELATI